MAGPGNSAISPFFESVFLNLLSYYEFMIQQTISQQCFLCWAKKELVVHPAMFPHLPEHLASRYVILYACVTMVLDSNGPTSIIKLKSMSLKQKQTAQNYFGSGQMYVLSILIISTTKGASEHTNSQCFLVWMSPCMATFAKRWVIQTSVFVYSMTWKGIE